MRLPGSAPSRGWPAARIRWPAAVALDVGCVLVFVAIGRASHHHGESAGGLASTAWPFLAGLAAGLLATRAWRRPAALVPAGLGAWLGAVAVGMLLRVLAGQGTAVAFIVVALAFLGLFLLGWRALAAAGARRGHAPSLDQSR
jgi:FtsH-binding integral membrane protein